MSHPTLCPSVITTIFLAALSPRASVSAAAPSASTRANEPPIGFRPSSTVDRSPALLSGEGVTTRGAEPARIILTPLLFPIDWISDRHSSTAWSKLLLPSTIRVIDVEASITMATSCWPFCDQRRICENFSNCVATAAMTRMPTAVAYISHRQRGCREITVATATSTAASSISGSIKTQENDEPTGVKGRATASAISAISRHRSARRIISSIWTRRRRLTSDPLRNRMAPHSTTLALRRLSKWMMIGIEIPASPARIIGLINVMP